ncbi:tripartite motif-containing protein 75-like [Suncus etruscus]|uniref:tripartite motif-containing protein 75-like n=1 Tax=Suncus etruscus TaxID=109475 RepID=UPI00210FAAEC|nr:tripartite motif-containing protein 75-like [Suncus etruscus]
MEMSATSALQAEAICPICQDNLNNPVTLKCQHNFCVTCIRMKWKNLLKTFPCPVCHQTQEGRRVSVNPQLGRLVDLANFLQGSRDSRMARENEPRCAEHQQELSFFCEDDKKLMCAMCTKCPEHQGHHIRSMKEAASHYRQQLGEYIHLLKKQMEEVKRLIVTQDRKILQLQEEVRKQRMQYNLDYEQFKQFMDCEKNAYLTRMEEEENHLLRQHNVSMAAHSAHIDKLRDLIVEVAELSEMSEEMVLRGLKGLQQHYKGLDPAPAVQLLNFRPLYYSLPPLCSVLSNIIQKFRENVTLDPQTAHPTLCVSEDLKSVTWVKQRLRVGEKPKIWEATAALVVLGRERFASGRHYWEVQVGHKPEWAVGVCTDAPCSEGQWFPSGRKRHWIIQLQDGKYLAAGSAVVPLFQTDKLTVIGIYLDYELGQVCFYNASDRSHLHSFSETFVQVLKPYFGTGCDSEPLRICVVDYEG